MGFEPTTCTLAEYRSSIELLPHEFKLYSMNPEDNNLEPLLETMLTQGDENSKQTNSLLETLVEQSAKENNVEPLLEAQLELGDKILGQMKKSDEEEKTEKRLTVQVQGLDVLTIKGDQGEKGDKGDKGDRGERGDKGDTGAQGLQGLKGDRGPEGKDGKNGLDGLDGQDGRDGKDGKPGKDGKDGSPDNPDQIIKKISGKFSYNQLKDIPTIFKKDEIGGIGYLRELSDVSLNNLQNNQVIKWNATTQKFENGTGGSGAVDSVNGQTGVVVLDTGDISESGNLYFTDERAQDAIGTILVDSNTLDFTYSDATPSITGDVRTQMSLTSDASGLKLSGDASAPGNSKYYGTNGSGTKGFYDLPGGGTGITRSIVTTSGSLTLGSTASIDYVYLVAGAHVLTLPTAVSNTNRYTVKNNHSVAITVNTTSAQTIDSTTSIDIAPEDSVDLISNNSNWFVI